MNIIHCISCSPKEINRQNLMDDGSLSGEKSILEKAFLVFAPRSCIGGSQLQ